MAALTDFAEVLAVTIDQYIPQLEDNIFTSKPLLWSLKNADRIKNYHGTSIVVPLMYAENPNQGVYADDDVFATAANTGLGAAHFQWRQFYGLVHFTGIELAKNSGEQAILSLLEARMQQLELTVAENLNTELWQGTDASNRWQGLEEIAGTLNNTVGDIDSTTFTWWDPQQTTTADPDADLTLAMMATLYNNASEGNDHPTNLFGRQSIFEKYESLLSAQLRFMDPTMADGGFQNLLYKGAPFTFDSQIAEIGTDGVLYFLNLKYLTLAKLNEVWFKPSEFLAPTNADVIYKHIRLYGNLVVSNRNRQGSIQST